MTTKMATVCSSIQSSLPNQSADDCEDVNMILTIIVKRRKNIPAKCMEINKQIFAFELQRLENARLDAEENSKKEKFKKIIQGLKRLKSFQLTFDDLHEAQKKLENSYKRTKEINMYLEKRKKIFN